jgi:hypothetical protein
MLTGMWRCVHEGDSQRYDSHKEDITANTSESELGDTVNLFRGRFRNGFLISFRFAWSANHFHNFRLRRPQCEM